MRVSSFIFMLLIVSFIFVGVGIIMEDFETQYNVDIDTSWEDEWDYTTNITQSSELLKTPLQDVEKGTFGWFISGIIAVSTRTAAECRFTGWTYPTKL